MIIAEEPESMNPNGWKNKWYRTIQYFYFVTFFLLLNRSHNLGECKYYCLRECYDRRSRSIQKLVISP